MIEAMLLGAGLLMLGFIMGRLHRPSRKPPPPPPEICLCGHAVSYHDKTKGCLKPTGQYKHKCACIRYVGPNTSYVPELDS